MDPQALFENYRRTITEHYFDMNGRVGRAQFWYFVLANFIAAILAHIVGRIVFLPVGELYNLAVLLPATCIGARRLQDIGRDGRLAWLLLILVAVTQIAAVLTALTFVFAGMFGLLFVPGLGIVGLATLVVAVVLIYFWCQPGDPGSNAYGPPPPVFDPSRPVSPPA
jgi:uncharacterized membrane protein YhaH (DUF805 family)